LPFGYEVSGDGWLCRNVDEVPNSNRKRLRPGKVSPPRQVPKHILRPPYVDSMVPAGIVSGPQVHDKKGIECMRASGRLAAQVLQYAGTLVKVSSSFFCLIIAHSLIVYILHKSLAVCYEMFM